MKKLLLIGAVVLLPLSAVFAQGFGFDSAFPEAEPPAGGENGVRVGGSVSGGLTFFVDDFDAPGSAALGDIADAKLNFSASGSRAEGFINLLLRPRLSTPAEILSIDEAYVRAFYGPLTVEGGVRKLAWGRADSFGPLDVINPLDYTDLSVLSDPLAVKIARPLVRAVFDTGNFTRLEAVFVPWFQGTQFAADGRWAPLEITALPARMMSDFAALVPAGSLPSLPPVTPGDIDLNPERLKTLAYFQAGLRFTASIASNDFGLQYYTGVLNRPAVTVRYAKELNDAIKAGNTTAVGSIVGSITAVTNPGDLVAVAYNRYHHIGVDYGRVLLGFNIRAEFAANITSDLSGDEGGVYNPALLWSAGFDHDLFAGINLNLQAAESIILFHGGIDPNRAIDTQAGSRVTATRLTAILSRKFFREELELKVTGLWGIEDGDVYLIPALVWTRGDAALELSGGVFAGNRDGELGQYRDNGFIKTTLTWSF